MNSSDENGSVKKRGLIVALLIISCTLSAYLLWTVEPQPVYHLHTPKQLDSLITDSFREFNLPDSRIRTQTIRIDSSFSRTRYVVEVPPSFSKTTFHYKLHERIWPYDAETIGNVYFPDKDLQIHIAYHETIHRTIFLYSDGGD